MQVQLIVAPYDSGRRNFRMGRGPEYLLESGLVAQLESVDIAVATTTLETSGDDVASAFDLARQIATVTVEARERAAFPVILAGNCMASLGGFAGVGPSAALLWLDAHADFNTPATSPSGFLDGMSLAVITGRCLTELSASVPGFQPLPDANLIMIGVRSVDPGEEAVLRRVKRVRSSRELSAALALIEAPALYLHIDLDVLDPSVLVANSFATPHGLSEHTLRDVIATAKANKRIAALALTAYDPAADRDNRGPRVVAEILRAALLDRPLRPDPSA